MPNDEISTLNPDVETLKNAKNAIENRQEEIIFDNLNPDSEYLVTLESPSFSYGISLPTQIFFNEYDLVERYPEGADSISTMYKNTPPEYIENMHNLVFTSPFNAIVPKNIFKPESIYHSGENPDYYLSDTVISNLQNNPELLEKVRGHCLFWNRKVHLPPHLVNAGTNEIYSFAKRHTREMLTRYPGIKEWDALNEPLKREPRVRNGVDRSEVVFDPTTEEGLNAMVDLLVITREANPETRLYINEYDILEGQKTEIFYELIRVLQSRGAPIDGIGLQGHFRRKPPPSLTEVKENLDRIAEFGIPIKITELDIGVEQFDGDEEARSIYMQGLLTIFHGTPAVEGVVLWGIQDQTNWRNDGTGLFHEDFSPNETGQAWTGKIDEWKTSKLVKTDQNGSAVIKGFPGRYSVTSATSSIRSH